MLRARLSSCRGIFLPVPCVRAVKLQFIGTLHTATLGLLESAHRSIHRDRICTECSHFRIGFLTVLHNPGIAREQEFVLPCALAGLLFRP